MGDGVASQGSSGRNFIDRPKCQLGGAVSGQKVHSHMCVSHVQRGGSYRKLQYSWNLGTLIYPRIPLVSRYQVFRPSVM